MSVDLSAVGANDLERLARDLRSAANKKELQKDLYRGIERGTKPAKEAVRANALRVLPARGGLAREVSKSSIRTKRRLGRDVSVALVASKKVKGKARDLRSLDRGRLRHPVFGNRNVWVNQRVPAGWFSDAVEREAPAVRRELVRVIDDVADKLVRRG